MSKNSVSDPHWFQYRTGSTQSYLKCISGSREQKMRIHEEIRISVSLCCHVTQFFLYGILSVMKRFESVCLQQENKNCEANRTKLSSLQFGKGTNRELGEVSSQKRPEKHTLFQWLQNRPSDLSTSRDGTFKKNNSKFTCMCNVAKDPWHWHNSKFRIHDILVWIQIRIRGSMPLTHGSGSCYFRNWPSRRRQKANFKKRFFCLLLMYIYIIFQT